MKHNDLGKTGVKVSELSFGAASLGEEYGPVTVDEGNRAVHLAIDEGVNYFDVAAYYGGRLAEERLGAALAGKRDKVVLATKVGRYKNAERQWFDFSEKAIRESLETSLHLLQTDYIDVYQLHDIEFVNQKVILEEGLPTMMRLKAEGKIRFVGITGYPVHILKDTIEKFPGIDTVLSYCRYNLLDTAMDAVLTPVAKAKGIGLVVASPLHMGILRSKAAPDWHPAPHRVHEAACRAGDYCDSKGVDLSALAMQFVLAYPNVDSTLVGMSKVRNVERNLKVLGTEADPEILAGVLEIFKPVANICWEEGLAENWDPGSVPQQS